LQQVCTFVSLTTQQVKPTTDQVNPFQLKSLAAPNSDEQQHLVEALIGMERVAEHINEMQRIHEEYGAIFDHLFRQHQKASKQVNHADIL
jgi:hypothetical protein